MLTIIAMLAPLILSPPLPLPLSCTARSSPPPATQSAACWWSASPLMTPLRCVACPPPWEPSWRPESPGSCRTCYTHYSSLHKSKGKVVSKDSNLAGVVSLLFKDSNLAGIVSLLFKDSNLAGIVSLLFKDSNLAGIVSLLF